jgi:hypothetical protein
MLFADLNSRFVCFLCVLAHSGRSEYPGFARFAVKSIDAVGQGRTAGRRLSFVGPLLAAVVWSRDRPLHLSGYLVS